VLSAYQLFVYSDAPFGQSISSGSLGSVPLPDRIVYVRAPIDLLVDRAMTRPDQRRELAGRSPDELRRSLERAIELFDGLAMTEPIRDRLLTVDIGDDSARTRDAAVREVARFVSPPIRPRTATGFDDPERPAAGEPAGTRPRIGLIAFVGSEASGKSTILNEVGELARPRSRGSPDPRGQATEHGPHLRPSRAPSGPPTLVPGAALAPGRGAVRRGSANAAPVFAAVRAALGDAGLRAASGHHPDGRSITERNRRPERSVSVSHRREPGWTAARASPAPSEPSLLRRVLAALEDRLYRDIPTPDLVFHLTAPLDVTLARNAARAKNEPEEYVRFRHAISADLRFDGTIVHRIDTDRELRDVLDEIEHAIDEASADAEAGAWRGSG
jgi:hypothetical protein